MQRILRGYVSISPRSYNYPRCIILFLLGNPPTGNLSVSVYVIVIVIAAAVIIISAVLGIIRNRKNKK